MSSDTFTTQILVQCCECGRVDCEGSEVWTHWSRHELWTNAEEIIEYFVCDRCESSCNPKKPG